MLRGEWGKRDKKKIKILIIHVKIDIRIRNYKFPRIHYTRLSSVVLIGVNHVKANVEVEKINKK